MSVKIKLASEKGGGDTKQLRKKPSNLKMTKSHSQARLRIGDGGGDGDGDFEAWMKSRQLLKPDDQLDLTEAELGEEISKVLTATNTNVIHNLVVYSFKEGEYVKVPLASNTVTLLSMDSTALHVDSEEAVEQVEELGEEGLPLPKIRPSVMDLAEDRDRGADDDDIAAPEPLKGREEETQTQEAAEGGEEEPPPEGEEGEEEEEGEEGEGGEVQEDQGAQGDDDDIPRAAEAQAPQTTSKRKRKLLNQFNFCERAALTFVNPKRNVETQTVPPPRAMYGSNVLQWTIFDSYANDYAEQQKEKDKKDEKRIIIQSDFQAKKLAKKILAEQVNVSFLKSWQILERMINQNIYEDIGNDYRYWEDPADEFREPEGTLLPLWKFQYERLRKFSVTDLSFNPTYYDLFAVCYGSHDFMRQPNEGCICFFTIKNPSFPDYIIPTESGVMSCDLHPTYPFLLVIGLYDGNVAVYNMREDYSKPVYVSMGVDSKHSECVWDVKWGPDMPDGEINFYSASLDGRVFNWVLMQNGLNITMITTLFIDNTVVEGPDGTEVALRNCCSCMRFHPKNPEIYLVGTEEGFIYKCSILYSSKHLMTYNAHHLTVYRIDFNRYNSNIFVSCSGDWRVKVWEDMRADPLFVFDLGSPVGDVKWAPYSSTVFAACTNEGKVFVFDLNVNKYKPICVQNVVSKRKNKLTRLAFNENLPVIIVGDDKSTVSSLKLSPNLRIMVKPPKKSQIVDQAALQTQKLEKLLSLVRELPDQPEIKDTTTTAKS